MSTLFDPFAGKINLMNASTDASDDNLLFSLNSLKRRSPPANKVVKKSETVSEYWETKMSPSLTTPIYPNYPNYSHPDYQSVLADFKTITGKWTKPERARALVKWSGDYLPHTWNGVHVIMAAKAILESGWFTNTIVAWNFGNIRRSSLDSHLDIPFVHKDNGEVIDGQKQIRTYAVNVYRSPKEYFVRYHHLISKSKPYNIYYDYFANAKNDTDIREWLEKIMPTYATANTSTYINSLFDVAKTVTKMIQSV